ncbi:MAG TPA: MTAP family purine nucleoside phosphorylase [Syntrophales bacterium]|jgi:5'-methylthioadenosine phosphorylase|nr:MTAP family purine nucleoside phosphorylase [Syntrophales bacterium]HRT61178.1 MTAP family purine nucleoside phosphorylase [Syntrophales bacterium]
MRPLGIIAGTVLHGANVFDGLKKEHMVNEFGRVTVWVSKEIVLISRHDRDPGEYVLPHLINHQANLTALKTLGIGEVVALNSTGSLKKELPPGSIVVPDDFILVADTPTIFSDRPVHITPELSGEVRRRLIEAAGACGIPVVERGVYWQTVGPRLETKAEIRMMASFADIVGMTMAAEAIIAQELGLSYAALCSVDNYCNGVVETPLTMETIIEGAKRNRETMLTIVGKYIERSRK